MWGRRLEGLESFAFFLVVFSFRRGTLRHPCVFPFFAPPPRLLLGIFALAERILEFFFDSNREFGGRGGRMRWEGVDDELARMVSEANLDDAPDRRRIRGAFKEVQLGIDHWLIKLYEVNSRGVEIFSKSWLPKNSSMKALVCFCHGYGDTCTFFFEGVARKLASSDFGVFAMDYPGFGLSEGLHGYIPSFDTLKSLSTTVFQTFCLENQWPEQWLLRRISNKPDSWNGAILVAPMCKQFLIGMAKLLPERQLVPHKDIGEMAFRDPKKLQQVRLKLSESSKRIS
ncbi:hypothetical protein ZIOFF_051688 [Zingiber officinale]|uniref:Serine aminopeptidase S33 domain-containing protein n=1 Tax=Zingiber officinale TaxID=94328 RepID=A0A8J5FJ42_ZINOF|nr:hypothetical protein ZIOFF_051688 [Zingiber officinale]